MTSLRRSDACFTNVTSTFCKLRTHPREMHELSSPVSSFLVTDDRSSERSATALLTLSHTARVSVMVCAPCTSAFMWQQKHDLCTSAFVDGLMLADRTTELMDRVCLHKPQKKGSTLAELPFRCPFRGRAVDFRDEGPCDESGRRGKPPGVPAAL